MRLKSVAILSASLLTLATVPAANAATFFFNLSGNSSLSGAYGNARTFSATTGGKTVNVRATAWSVSSNVVQNAYLGSYGAGLGVTNQGEGSGGNNSHTTDNSGRVDFILFQFDKPVEFLSGRFTTFCDGCTQDSDATIDYGTIGAPWSSSLALNNTNLSVINGLLNGSAFEATGGAASSGVVRDLQPGNPGDKIGNLWMVAATFNNTDRKADAFKFDDLSVSYIDPLPEPASWALMLGGFGMVGFSLRRSRAVATA